MAHSITSSRREDPMARQFTRTRGRLGAKRLTQWIAGAAVDNALTSAGSEVLVQLLTTEEKALRPFTIIRTRGILGLASDQIAASEDQSAAFAMAVVFEQAAGIGITVVPTPVTDQESDLFFVYEDMINDFVLLSGVISTPGVKVHRFDSKAMRKVNPDQDVAVVKANTALSDGTTFYSRFRMLVKLH